MARDAAGFKWVHTVPIMTPYVEIQTVTLAWLQEAAREVNKNESQLYAFELPFFKKLYFGKRHFWHVAHETFVLDIVVTLPC